MRADPSRSLTNARPSSIYRLRPLQTPGADVSTGTLGIQIQPLAQLEAIAGTLPSRGTGVGAQDSVPEGALVRRTEGVDVPKLAEKIVKNVSSPPLPLFPWR